jgi:hypothetical protein
LLETKLLVLFHLFHQAFGAFHPVILALQLKHFEGSELNKSEKVEELL